MSGYAGFMATIRPVSTFDNVDSELVIQPLQSKPKDIGRFMLTTLMKRMYIRRHGWQ